MTDIVPNFGYSPENSKTWSYGLKKMVLQFNQILEKRQIFGFEKKGKKNLDQI